MCGDYDRAACEARAWRRARKMHKCCACGEAISKGHRYHYTSGIWHGEPASFKHCERCWEMFNAILGASDRSDTVLYQLNCGTSWSEAFGDEPPPRVAALAFAVPADYQERL